MSQANPLPLNILILTKTPLTPSPIPRFRRQFAPRQQLAHAKLLQQQQQQQQQQQHQRVIAAAAPATAAPGGCARAGLVATEAGKRGSG